jgi:heme exporter protein A
LSRLVAIPRPVWLLDEPAAGLDRSGKALLAALIESHRAAGGIVAAAVHEPLGPTPSLGLELGG